jgi:hypothetical protein
MGASIFFQGVARAPWLKTLSLVSTVHTVTAPLACHGHRCRCHLRGVCLHTGPALRWAPAPPQPSDLPEPRGPGPFPPPARPLRPPQQLAALREKELDWLILPDASDEDVDYLNFDIQVLAPVRGRWSTGARRGAGATRGRPGSRERNKTRAGAVPCPCSCPGARGTAGAGTSLMLQCALPLAVGSRGRLARAPSARRPSPAGPFRAAPRTLGVPARPHRTTTPQAPRRAAATSRGISPTVAACSA